jgi:hypothetical protein
MGWSWSTFPTKPQGLNIIGVRLACWSRVGVDPRFWSRFGGVGDKIFKGGEVISLFFILILITIATTSGFDIIWGRWREGLLGLVELDPFTE